MGTLVSVIIPIYNVEQYLAKCLDSVINQTYKDLEIICVNDCSPDNSAKILEEYSKKDNRIKIINREQNGGLSAARNSGMEIMTGDYVYFLDSDDWIDNNYIEELVSKMEEKNVDMIINANVKFEYEIQPKIDNSNSIEYSSHSQEGEYISPYDCFKNPRYKIWAVWTHLYKSKLIKENNVIFPDGYINEDVYFGHFYAHYAKNVYIFRSNSAYHYVIRNSSITKNNKSNAISHIKVWGKMLELYRRNGWLNNSGDKLFELDRLIEVSLEDEYNQVKKFLNDNFDYIKSQIDLYNEKEIFILDALIKSMDFQDFKLKYPKGLKIGFALKHIRQKATANI